MARKAEIGNVQLYPGRPLRKSDTNGYVLKFYCPIRCARIRRNTGTRDRREARRIQKECQQRLLSGRYVESGGAITEVDERLLKAPTATGAIISDERRWGECVDAYREYFGLRMREVSHPDTESRLRLAERIFESRRESRGLSTGVTLAECFSREAIEHLQNRLLAGEFSRYGTRSPHTVNSIVRSVMTFGRYCVDHEWLPKVPRVRKIEGGEPMKGRPITGEEYERMLGAVAAVVGSKAAEPWQFTIRLLWESGLRISDVMDLHWDDDRHIVPIWPRRENEHPTLHIPSTQKSKKISEIPMLPGLRTLLESIPRERRTDWVANPPPIEFEMASQSSGWFMPCSEDLERLIRSYSNSSIARACGVSDVAVRKWLRKLDITRSGKIAKYGCDIPEHERTQLRLRARRAGGHRRASKGERLTEQHVSRVIAAIGKKAGIVVRQEDAEAKRRVKYASAHDLRRSCAERLINAGVSAESLMVIMRHEDFATTLKYYGAKRAAQAAAAEVVRQLGRVGFPELVGGLVGGNDEAPRLSPEELRKLKALLKGL